MQLKVTVQLIHSGLKDNPLFMKRYQVRYLGKALKIREGINSRLNTGSKPIPAAACLLGLRFRIPPWAWMLCVVGYKSLRRADHSSRGVVSSVVCQCDLETSTMSRSRPNSHEIKNCVEYLLRVNSETFALLSSFQKEKN